MNCPSLLERPSAEFKGTGPRQEFKANTKRRGKSTGLVRASQNLYGSSTVWQFLFRLTELVNAPTR